MMGWHCMISELAFLVEVRALRHKEVFRADARWLLKRSKGGKGYLERITYHDTIARLDIFNV